MIGGPPILLRMSDGEVISDKWADWFSEAFSILMKDKGSGPTAGRPTNGISVSDYYFDTTLGIPIWYDGTNWIDATGSTV